MSSRRFRRAFDETRIEERLIDGRQAVVYEAIRYRSPKRKDEAHQSTRRGRTLMASAGACLVLLSAAAVAYFRLLRPWHMNWGATDAEARGRVAGDDLMADEAPCCFL